MSATALGLVSIFKRREPERIGFPAAPPRERRLNVPAQAARFLDD
ncbi:hypothetical protein [Cupriavidus sp. D39]|nr:hypothetical protein [Cupriavidus sp. D39]MCY0853350.1 hypothetical protein [Cupriavidus sp. D39]